MKNMTKAAGGFGIASLAAFFAAIPLSVALALPASADPVMAPYPQSPACVDENNNFVCDPGEPDADVPDIPDASPWECVPAPGIPCPS